MRRWVLNTARRVPWTALVLLATGPAAAQTVTLHPGALSGIISLGSETMSSGEIHVTAGDNLGYSARTGIHEPSYTLTVEAGGSYRAQLFAHLDDGAGATHLRIDGRQTSPVHQATTVQNDFSYDTARIHGNIIVTDGVVSSYIIQADASAAVEHYSSTSARSGTSSFSIPMILGSAVQVWGIATVLLPSGATLTLPLEHRTVSLGAGGTSLDWTLDVTNLQGTISTSVILNGPDIVDSHHIDLHMSSAVVGSTNLAPSGSHDFFPLAPGAYSVSARTNFDAPYGYLEYPSQTLSLTEGGVETRSFGGDLAFLRGRLNVQGFYTLADVSSADVHVTRVDASGSWSAKDHVDVDSGDFDLAITPGDWMAGGYDIHIDAPHPTMPVNARIYRDPASSRTVGVGAAEDLGGEEIEISTVMTQIVYNMVDLEGTAVGVASPRLHGWGAAGNYIDATGSSTEQLNPALQVVAVPDTYEVYASALVGGSQITFDRFSLVVNEPTALMPAADAPILFFPGIDPDNQERVVTLDFGPVITGGWVAVTASTIGPSPPSGFRLDIYDQPISYIDVTTTASFTPPVRICVSYGEDMSPLDLHSLRLLHFTNGTWRVLTETYIDMDWRLICAETYSFSVFALMQLDDAGDDCVLDTASDGADNCPLVAITTPWSEATIAHASFGAAFDPAVEASFAPPAGVDGHPSCDLTDLAHAWTDPSLPDNSMLLRELGPNRHRFRTSEHTGADAHTRLDVCGVTP